MVSPFKHGGGNKQELNLGLAGKKLWVRNLLDLSCLNVRARLILLLVPPPHPERLESLVN